MAITMAGHAVRMTSGDSLTGTQRIQAIYAEGATTLEDTSGNEIIDLAEGDDISFPQGIQVDGISASGTGPVFIYLQ